MPVRGAPGAIYGVVRFVDMQDGTVAQAACLWHIFSLVQIVMRPGQQFIGAGKTIVPAKAHVDGWMVIGVLAVIDGRVLDLANGCIDLGDGVIVFMPHRLPLPAFAEVGASVTEVIERVEVSGMRSRHLGTSCRRKQSDGADKQREQQ